MNPSPLAPAYFTVTGDSPTGVNITITGSDVDGLQGSNLTLTVTPPTSGNLYYGQVLITSSSQLPLGALQPATFTNTQGAQQGTSTYTLTYIPATFFSGVLPLSFYMSDSLNGQTPITTSYINVTFVDHAPTVTGPPNVVCNFGANCIISLTIFDVDVKDFEMLNITQMSVTNALSLNATSGSVNTQFASTAGAVSAFSQKISATGPFTVLDPLATQSTASVVIAMDNNILGSLGSITFAAQDSYGKGSALLTVGLVAQTSTAPFFLPALNSLNQISLNGTEDYNTTVLIIGGDADGQQGVNLTLSIVTPPGHGTLYAGDVPVVFTAGQSVYTFPASLNVPTTATLTSSFNLTYVPNPLFYGNENFVIQLTDSVGTPSVYVTVAIAVNHTNHAPTGADFVAYGMSGVSLTLDRWVASDIDGDAISLVIDSLPAVGQLLNSNTPISLSKRTFVPLPQASWTLLNFLSAITEYGNPLTHFTYHFVDTHLAPSPIYNGTLYIALSDRAPLAENTPISGKMDEMIPFIVNATDLNGHPGTLSITLTTAPLGQLCLDVQQLNCLGKGSVYRNESTTLYYFPPTGKYSTNNVTALETLTYYATDAAQQSSSPANISVIVNFFNNPPVATFPTILTVYELSSATLTLTATDDHTPAQSLKYYLSQSVSNGTLTLLADEAGEEPEVFNATSTVPVQIISERNTFRFTPTGFDFGDNYTQFTVLIYDTDGGITTVPVTVNVIHVNQPPTMIPGDPAPAARENNTLIVTFNATDVDSPMTSLVAVILNQPSRGSLHKCIYNEVTGGCDIGDVLDGTSSATSTINNTLTFADHAVFMMVFVPINGSAAMVYATPAFFIYDNYLAESQLYVPRIRIRTINQAPYATVTAPAEMPILSTVQLNVTVGDPDAGSIPIRMILTVDNGSLNFTNTQPFTTKTRFSSCSRITNGINCTASQITLNNYLKRLVLTSPGTAGVINMTVFVDDLGAGADPDEVATSAKNVSGVVTVGVYTIADTPPASAERNLTWVIGVGSAAGALGAAAAVGLVAKIIRKPEDEIFASMLDFESGGVVDNPLFVENSGDVNNPLYESTAL